MSHFTFGFHFLTGNGDKNPAPATSICGFEIPMDVGSQFVGAGLAGGPGLKLAGGVAKFLPIYPGVTHP